MSRAGILALGAAALAIVLPSSAGADDGGSRDDVRVTRSCTATSRAELRVRARDHGQLRVDLELRTGRRGATWTVVLVHERRLVLRGDRRTDSSSGSLSVRRTIDDWFGEDTVNARATGPGGELCRVSATVLGD